MIISFFEEYPTALNLQKLRSVSWPTKLYIAAKSVTEFEKIISTIKNKKVTELVYWPILEKNEGYWISPFSERKALQRIFAELNGKNISVMLDLELPLTRNPMLLLTQFFSFYVNRARIRNFIQDYRGKTYLAEYHPQGTRKEQVLQFLGLHYTNPKAYVIKMMYHSMYHISEEVVRRDFRQGVQAWGDHFIAGLGTIATGVLENEPILSEEQLRSDLRLAREAGVKEVVVFRLGGLNELFVKVFSK